MIRYNLPDLYECFQDRDFGYLKVVADFWGIKLAAPDVRTGIKTLIIELKNPERLRDVIDDLPSEAHTAFFDLQKNGGTKSWSLFVRQYGGLREIGSARRDREQTYRNPISATEILWYRGLIGRSFFNSSTGPQELVYIPREFAAAELEVGSSRKRVFGQLAKASQYKVVIPHYDRILDDSVTLLAALRTGEQAEAWITDSWLGGNLQTTYMQFLLSLLTSAGLLDQKNLPNINLTRSFLGNKHSAAYETLVRAWQESLKINELRMLPDLVFEGGWINDTLHARRTILKDLMQAPGQQFDSHSNEIGEIQSNSFVSIESIIESIYKYDPDFQRPTGDYDSWFIKREGSTEYLRGYEYWDQIEGAYIRFMITGPLYWLGLVELAGSSSDVSQKNIPAEAFRFSDQSRILFEEEYIFKEPEQQSRCLVRSDGTISLPRNFLPVVRYQIARFCEWVGFDGELYTCKLTPVSLERAAKQSLQVSHLISLLQKYSSAFPPSLEKTLARWEEFGQEISIEKPVILRVKRPETLLALRNSRAAKYLGDILGPTTVIINSGAEEIILRQLIEMGYLGDIKFDE